MINCLIIGSGPAGYTAATYAARANLNPVIYEGFTPGGQLTTTSEIENFPGFPEGITGPELMEKIRSQAARFGAEIHSGRITEVNFDVYPFTAKDDKGNWLEAKTIIIATGATALYLGLPDEDKYKGQGVSACATCDGFFYRKRTVAVVGGGDTACEEALYLSNLASKVYMIVRKPHLRASKVMQQRVIDKENIEILYNCNTVGLFGDEFLEGAHLVEHKGTADERHFDIAIDGFFLAIGHRPETEIFKPFIELDEQGYIKTFNGTTETSVKGVFAAGDVADPRYRQAVSAAGMGCRAALDAEAFLLEHE
ncbi:MAG: thioredoxin-disulfide reductase [Bacteroidales bacterium]|nr:thioredoxin-disulfide reductase [Bacteroidales bacterium]MBD5282776.1 thioredoxin-disulfide reductase [Bacteroides sp.]MDE6032599.1 thioredoxin-disulfide reductase [Muribaculaceae bacterium]MBD5343041.1 thioredoxin-disulfide reductase [Bacteroides sp.]MBD5360550.1 thioredoxin-disulfide reductase [Bacteroides sp.]